MKKRKDLYKIRKADMILCLVIIFFSLGIYFLMLTPEQNPKKGLIVVTIDGKEYNRYPLDQDQTVSIKQNNWVNCLEIKNGKVKMIKADCPDAYCTKQKAISKKGQSIICLPHKLSVEILESDSQEETTDKDIDAVVK